jgi:2,3-dihydroxybiphenyl 1,2-dioxygenase
MVKVDELAYIGIGAKDPDAWRGYAVHVLGLEVTGDSDATNLYLRMDERHHRFIVNPHVEGPEDVTYLGWQVRDAAAMDAIAAKVSDAGVEVTTGSDEEAGVRRVLGFVHFTDPHCGVRMEISYGPEVTYQPPFHSPRAIDGFVTGNLGLGHFVSYVPDVVAAEAFYASTLGLAPSDVPSMPGIGQVASFMYCNPRHHSFAVFGNPTPKRRTYHVMLEHSSLDDVGSALDICRSHEQVKVDLGRHNNDRMVSFYTESPSGWLIELGWGARTIDPDTFAVEHYTIGGGNGFGEWGHSGLMESMLEG